MAHRIPKVVDSELFTLLPGVMRKSIDTNIFLAEEAEQTLKAIAGYCGEGKVITALLHYTNMHNKTALSRAKIAMAFTRIIERMGHQITRLRDLQTFLATLINFASNASPEVRSEARKALQTLAMQFSSRNDLESLL
jgi:hypothetical protein